MRIAFTAQGEPEHIIYVYLLSRETLKAFSSLYIFVEPCRKYEELCAPGVEEFCFITANTYTRPEVINIQNTHISVSLMCTDS